MGPAAIRPSRRRAHSAAAFAGALAAALVLGQDPTPPPSPVPPAPDDADPPVGVLGYRASQRKELADGLIGAWKLDRYFHPDQPIPEGDVVGAAMFGRETMSITMHVRSLRPFASGPDFFVQGGIHYWRIDEVLRLQTSALIAHSDLTGVMTYERAFEPREFEIALADDRLTLQKPDTSRLEFSRIQVDAFPEQAIQSIRDARAARPR